MKKPFFFNRIILSIRSKEFYKLVIKEHFMISFVYLMVISFLFSLIPATAFSIQVSSVISIISDLIHDPNCPDFTIEGSQLIIDGQKPFIYSDEINQKYKIILDPTGTSSFNELAGYENGFLLTGSKIINYGKNTPLSALPTSFFSMYNGITKDYFLKNLNSYNPILFTVLFCIVIFLGMIYSLFLSLIASSISFFTRTVTGINISYSQNYKITMYAMTLPLFFSSVLFAFSYEFAQMYHFMIFIVVYGIISGSIMTYIQKSSTE